LSGRTELKYYEAGLDLGLSNDPHESFRLFQQRIVHEYEAMVHEFGLTVMDAILPIPEQQRHMRELIRPHLQGVRKIRGSAKEAAWATLARDMRPSRP
jgi:dTMP kinase